MVTSHYPILCDLLPFYKEYKEIAADLRQQPLKHKSTSEILLAYMQRLINQKLSNSIKIARTIISRLCFIIPYERATPEKNKRPAIGKNSICFIT